jgi:drug/metabolite transporter (DMT)-like permease
VSDGGEPDGARLLDSPVILLILAGGMIGLTFPLGKLAGEAGVPPIAWALLISLGAMLLLAPIVAMRRLAVPRTSQFWRYSVISGVISYVIPNLLLFACIPHLGAGLTGLFYTLSPIVTLAMSLAVRMRMPGLLGLTGIGLGFAGAVLLAMSRGDVNQPAAQFWLAVAFLIPVSLAAGNVYRTIDWPDGADPLVLAVGSNVAAAVVLLSAYVLVEGGLPFAHYLGVPRLSAVQAVSSAFLFFVFFRLQRAGGPIYLSQIGYVAAAVGLFSGTVFLGERYPLQTWAGAAIIAAGVALTTIAQIRSQPR